MKKFLLFLFILVFDISQIFSQNSITIVTYNIWYDNPNNTGNTWDDRKAGVIKTLKDLHPDIFGVQEAFAHQVADLEFGKYKHVGVGRDDGKKAGEYSAIFYDTTRFEKLADNTFWLSEYPDSAGLKGWDAACVRIATWVKLKDRTTGDVFLVFNTHFDHMGDTARLQSAKLIKSKIAQIANGYPVILTGDFNCRKGSEPYDILTGNIDKPILYDCRYRIDNQIKFPDYSFVGSDFNGESGNIIDHIFITGKWKILQYFIIENCKEGKCPSDHLPVVAEIQFIERGN